MRFHPNQSLGQIVTEQYYAARVFEKYGLDFCCKGKRSLSSACAEQGLDVDSILNELEIDVAGTNPQTIFSVMSCQQLINHIIANHHTYVRECSPTIKEHVDRVAFKHGDRFPWMKEVAEDFTLVYTDLLTHMQKEELILFPRIAHLELQGSTQVPATYLSAPINAMEAEHEEAGQYMQRIKELTNNFTPPENACTTHRVSLLELKAFEENLHQHVHLENNILFPGALKL